MPTPIRQLVVTALDALFKTIKTANGYNTNIDTHVFWWRDTPLQQSELPAIQAKDTVDTIVRAVGQHEHSLEIEAIISLRSSDSGATARLAEADLIKALGTNVSPNVCLGGYAEDISPPISEVIEVQHEEIKVFGLAVKFTVQFATAPFDPYTQV